MLKQTLILLTPLMLCAANWQETLNTAVNAASSTQTTTKTTTTSQSTATSGVKEALSLGAKQAVSLLGKENGYLNNSAVKIPLPSSMQPIATAAEKL